MAATGRLSLPSARPFGLPLRPVTALRLLIIVVMLAGWEALAASGLLYRDVVPSLGAIGRALFVTLRDPSFYFHLGTTGYEIAIAMLIGGLSGLMVGIVLGASAFIARAYEACGLWRDALEAYQLGVEIDNLAEDFHRGLMACHWELGDRAASLTAYRRCSELLTRTLGIQPSSKTLALHQSVRHEARRRRLRAPALSTDL